MDNNLYTNTTTGLSTPLKELRSKAQYNAGRRKPLPGNPAYDASLELDRILYKLFNDKDHPYTLQALADMLGVTRQGVKYRIDRYQRNH